jgi:hypothetical protein
VGYKYLVCLWWMVFHKLLLTDFADLGQRLTDV